MMAAAVLGDGREGFTAPREEVPQAVVPRLPALTVLHQAPAITEVRAGRLEVAPFFTVPLGALQGPTALTDVVALPFPFVEVADLGREIVESLRADHQSVPLA